MSQRTRDLGRNGHLVTIRWIPSHVGLLGHDKADKNARAKAHKGGKPLEKWSSLTHMKESVSRNS